MTRPDTRENVDFLDNQSICSEQMAEEQAHAVLSSASSFSHACMQGVISIVKHLQCAPAHVPDRKAKWEPRMLPPL